MTAGEIIRTLRDVEGVEGSFVVGEEGSIVSQDMPAYFDLQTLHEVGPRVWRLLDAWTVESAEAECTLRFSKHRLYLRGLDGAVLCILLAGQVRMTALRAAAQMVTRRLERMRESAPGEAESALPPAVAAQPDRRMRRDSTHGPGAGASVERPNFRIRNNTPGARGPAGEPEAHRRKRVRIFRGQRFEY